MVAHDKGYCSVDGCMNRRCNVDGCTNKGCIKELTFFKLPKEADRRKEWLKLIGRADLLQRKNLNHTSYRICAEHFDDSLIKLVKILISGALPTKKLPNKTGPCSEPNINRITISKNTLPTKQLPEKTGLSKPNVKRTTILNNSNTKQVKKLKKKKRKLNNSVPVPQYTEWKNNQIKGKSKTVKAQSNKTKAQLADQTNIMKNDNGDKYDKIEVDLEVEHIKTEMDQPETDAGHLEIEIDDIITELEHDIVSYVEKTKTKVDHRSPKVEQREKDVKYTEFGEKNMQIKAAHIKTEELKENLEAKLETDVQNQEMLFEEIEFEPMYIKEEIVDDTEEMEDWPITLYPFKNKFFN